MGDGKVRIMDLACRGGALDDKVSAVCKQRLLALCRYALLVTFVRCSQLQRQRLANLLRIIPLEGPLARGMGR